MSGLRVPRAARLALAAALLALAAAPGEASAQPVDFSTRMTARKLGDEALKLFEKREWAAALEKFDLANQLIPAPTLVIRSARCLVQLGRLVEASERYLEAIRMQLPPNAPFQHKKAQVEALDEREKLMPRIPGLTVTLEGPRGKGVTLKLDGKPMPEALLGQKQPVDPGEHRIEVAREDTKVKGEVELAEGKEGRLDLKLPPLPKPPPPPPPPEPPEAKTYRTLGWIGVGAGGGLLVLGAANGVAALGQRGSLLDKCPDARCTPEHHAAADVYDATRVVSSVGLIGGAVLGAAGVTLLLLAPGRPAPGAPPPADAAAAARPAPRPQADVFVTWGGAGVRGIF